MFFPFPHANITGAVGGQGVVVGGGGGGSSGSPIGLLLILTKP